MIFFENIYQAKTRYGEARLDVRLAPVGGMFVIHAVFLFLSLE
jgi:hypothetical protein